MLLGKIERHGQGKATSKSKENSWEVHVIQVEEGLKLSKAHHLEIIG